jgi:uncharacterized protein (DUF302 family)
MKLAEIFDAINEADAQDYEEVLQKIEEKLKEAGLEVPDDTE